MTPGHVEIASGIISSQEHHSAQGKRMLFKHIGERWFFVDAVEADGGRVSLWDGPTYEAAIFEAEVCAREGWGPVLDLVL
ncbi:hypothetical protein [Oceanicola sp. S124]|uniref:hypothetical protein n=1 Tax=Oceanicola sp. S124 TaxID=1042378 RepID=UPI000255900D|nr:hypothetical protein [Oceanicola sp. S124]